MIYFQTDQWGEWSGAMDWIPCSHARFLQLGIILSLKFKQLY